MAVLHADWHEYLLSKDGEPVRDVLVQQRKIHKDILEFLPIGAIPPGYDLTAAINAAKAAMVSDEAKASQEELERTGKAVSQSKRLDDWLQNPFGRTDAQKPLTMEQFICSKSNWIARFYSNAQGDYISANLRCSWEKNFAKIQPLPYMGIYRLLEPDDTRPVAFSRLLKNYSRFHKQSC